jgi:hypothetical protein
MFKSNFVTSIKSNGKFFRENGDTIQIPFGSEYSIFLKNLDSRRATVKIYIDGQDVLDGKKLIVEGQSQIELDGYMTGTTSKNKFKFIKMIKEIEDHRGVTPEDGLISVEFDREIQRPIYIQPIYLPYIHYDWNRPYTITTTSHPDWTYISSSTVNYRSDNNVQVTNCFNLSDDNHNDNGITVKGSDISQQFQYGYVGEMENRPTTITMKLIGFDPKQEKLVFTTDKLTCSSCGLKSRNFNKFCPRCGTRLLSE